MLYILFGEDQFSLTQALEEIKQGLGEGELRVANTTTLDGRALSLGHLIPICNTAPFLAPRRLVIIERLLGRFEPRPGRARRSPPEGWEEWRGLKGFLREMPSTTLLVLVEGRLSSRNPLLGELRPVAEVKEFPLLRGLNLYRWIQTQVKERGGQISYPAVRLLGDMVGGNLWFLAGEIEKLCLYCQGHPIGEEEVRLLVSQAREATIFSLIDAILDGKPAAALSFLHQLLTQGAAAPYVLFMVARQLRHLVLAKEITGLPQGEVGERLGVTSEFALRKTLDQAGDYTLEQLGAAYLRLLEADLAIKTGRAKDELALDLLVAQLSQPASP